MMRKISYRPYLGLLLFLLALFSLPEKASEKMRSLVVGTLSPFWKGFRNLKNISTPPLKEDTLLQENQRLKLEIDALRQWLLSDDRMMEETRNQFLSDKIALENSSLPAKVIFREPISWSSALWINVGEQDNEILNKKIVCKNSPVLLGPSIVGVVEKVERARSRVRLITDSSLSISVRAMRGKTQNRDLLEHVEALLFALTVRGDLFFEAPSSLYALKNSLETTSEDLYLAKGELCGTGNPLWRSRGQVLKGIGFNYDFADARGPARDLRTGQPYGTSTTEPANLLLQVGDLLVTTGLDGIFPAGFRVAIVSSVQLLTEGASSYDIQAIATAGNFDELAYLSVLPPIRE